MRPVLRERYRISDLLTLPFNAPAMIAAGAPVDEPDEGVAVN